MRAKDIEIGTVCYANVSGSRVEVEVIGDRGCRGRRYYLKRTDNNTVLTALRSSTALHATRGGYWAGISEPQSNERQPHNRGCLNPSGRSEECICTQEDRWGKIPDDGFPEEQA